MKPSPNFTALWTRYLTLSDKYSDDKTKAILMNNRDKRERILRRLGVIGEADLRRVEAAYKNRT